MGVGVSTAYTVHMFNRVLETRPNKAQKLHLNPLLLSVCSAAVWFEPELSVSQILAGAAGQGEGSLESIAVGIVTSDASAEANPSAVVLLASYTEWLSQN